MKLQVYISFRKGTVLMLFLSLTMRHASAQYLYNTDYYEKIYDKQIWGLSFSSFERQFMIFDNQADSLNRNVLDFRTRPSYSLGVTRTTEFDQTAINVFTNAFADNDIQDQFAFSTQYNYMGRRSLLELDFAYSKGFQLMDPNMPDTAIYAENLVTWYAGVKWLRFVNYRKFSYNAAYMGGHRQLKSAGSLFYGGAVAFDRFNHSQLIPDYREDFFQNTKRLRQGNIPQISIGGGYTGTVVIAKRVFFNGFISAYPGIILAHYKINDADRFRAQPSIRSDIRVSLGYNGKRFYIRNVFSYNIWFTGNEKFSLFQQLFSSTFALGYRFGK